MREVRVIASGAIANGVADATAMAKLDDGHTPVLGKIDRFSTQGCFCDHAFHATAEVRDRDRGERAVLRMADLIARRFGVRFERDVDPLNIATRFLFACCDQLEDTMGGPGSIPRVMGDRAGIFIGMCSAHVNDARYLAVRAMREPEDRSLRILHGMPVGTGTLVKLYLGWSPAANISIQVTTTACSASLDAIGRASAAVLSGRLDYAIAGGVDVVSEPVLRGFDASRVLSRRPCRPFDSARSGFQLGEGAGLVALSASPLVGGEPVIESMGTAVDRYHLTNPDPGGRGLERALAGSQTRGSGPVGGVIGHGTATPRYDDVELGAYARCLPAGTPVTSIKSTFGHTLGAAGVHGVLTGLRVLDTGVLPGIRNLETPLETPLRLGALSMPLLEPRVAITAAAFGGHNLALVLAEAS
jgi:3-oxoacyl-(acyl-carrier-protein) synthase